MTDNEKVANEQVNEIQEFNDLVDIKDLALFTPSQLGLFNGVDKEQLYVGIRGLVYDVTGNAKSYGPGKAYHKLVAKDSTRLLAISKLQMGPEEVYESDEANTWYTGDLTEKQNAVADKWVEFFKKRYKIVGVIVRHQAR